MLVWILVLLFSLYLLYKASDIAEEELVRYAEYSRITHLAVGFIFLAAATSLPELAISIGSGFLKNQEISVGVSLGNVLYDLLFVLPIVAIWYGVKVSKDNLYKIKLLSFSSIATLFPIIIFKQVNRIYALIMITTFLILSRILLKKKQEKYRYSSKEERFKNKLLLAISLISISVLSFLINLSVKNISETMKISTIFIGSLFISIFTASPELFVCLNAAKRKNYDIIIGTIYGTLLFDTIFVIGSTALLSPITISNFNHLIILYSFLFLTLISITLMVWKKEEIELYHALFLLMLLAFWIFLSILSEI